MEIGQLLDDWGVLKHNTYMIQKGDSPESVSQKLKIPLYELRSYHNFSCAENIDVINADFPHHLQYLLLNPSQFQNKVVEEISAIAVHFENGFTIPFHHVWDKNSYIVFQTIESNEQSQTIKYKVTVECLKKDKNGYSLFKIDRISKIYLNNLQTDTVADTIAEEVSTILYPLLIVVNEVGKWIDIHNFNDICERWGIVKRNILEKNEGSAIKKYLNAVESVLDNTENLLRNLSDDWFLKVFFNGIHTNYTSNLSFMSVADFAITPKETPVKFAVEQKIDKYLNTSNRIVIEKKGILEDMPKETLSHHYQSGNYQAIYHLDPNTYTIENAILECDVTSDTYKKVTVKMYNLNDRKITVSNPDQSFFISETIKKESFFKDLFKLH